MTRLETEQAEQITKLRRLLHRANTRVRQQRLRAEFWKNRAYQWRKR
jgi:hypothetical protein